MRGASARSTGVGLGAHFEAAGARVGAPADAHLAVERSPEAPGDLQLFLARDAGDRVELGETQQSDGAIARSTVPP